MTGVIELRQHPQLESPLCDRAGERVGLDGDRRLGRSVGGLSGRTEERAELTAHRRS